MRGSSRSAVDYYAHGPRSTSPAVTTAQRTADHDDMSIASQQCVSQLRDRHQSLTPQSPRRHDQLIHSFIHSSPSPHHYRAEQRPEAYSSLEAKHYVYTEIKTKSIRNPLSSECKVQYDVCLFISLHHSFIHSSILHPINASSFII